MSEKIKEKIVCDVCGITYTDNGSIMMAKLEDFPWPECSSRECPGTMHLITEKKEIKGNHNE